ncbi:MAG: hypothetical protein QGF33_13315, partial [Alphaproteobacteria bacterium]|nr:hypothetical protein [Alphaproteobacteria bacterium]
MWQTPTTAAACAAIFPPDTSVAGREAVRTLVALLAGLDALTKARQQRAADAGALLWLLGEAWPTPAPLAPWFAR